MNMHDTWSRLKFAVRAEFARDNTVVVEDESDFTITVTDQPPLTPDQAFIRLGVNRLYSRAEVSFYVMNPEEWPPKPGTPR